MLNKIKKYFCKTMSVYENEKMKVPAFAWMLVSSVVLIFLYAFILIVIGVSTKIYESVMDGTLITKIVYIITSHEFIGFGVFAIISYGFILLCHMYSVQITSFLSRFDLVCKRIEPSENIKKIASDIEDLSPEDKKQLRVIMPAILRRIGE